jgi:hypothetical protein
MEDGEAALATRSSILNLPSSLRIPIRAIRVIRGQLLRNSKPKRDARVSRELEST